MKKNNFLGYAAIFSIFFFAGAGTYMNPAVQTFIEAFPEISQSTIMMVVTLPSLISMFVMLLVGSVVGKKLSYRLCCILGTALIIAGGLMPYFVKMSWSAILICRAFVGVGVGFYGVRNSLLVKSVPEDKQASFIGYGTVAITVGSCVLQPVVGWLAEIGYRHTFLVDLIAIIPLVLCLFFLKEPASDAVKTAANNQDSQEPALNKNEKLGWKVFAYAILQFLATVSLYPLLSGMSTFMASHQIGSAAIAGAVLSSYNLAGVVPNMILSPILKVLKKFTIAFMALLVVLGQAVVLYFPGVFTAFLGTVVCGIGFMAMFGILQVYNAQAAPPSKVALGSTIILAFNQLAVFASSYFITGCSAIFKMQGSPVDSAFFGCIVVYAAIVVFAMVAKIAPAQKNQ